MEPLARAVELGSSFNAAGFVGDDSISLFGDPEETPSRNPTVELSGPRIATC